MEERGARGREARGEGAKGEGWQANEVRDVAENGRWAVTFAANDDRSRRVDGRVGTVGMVGRRALAWNMPFRHTVTALALVRSSALTLALVVFVNCRAPHGTFPQMLVRRGVSPMFVELTAVGNEWMLGGCADTPQLRQVLRVRCPRPRLHGSSHAKTCRLAHHHPSAPQSEYGRWVGRPRRMVGDRCQVMNRRPSR